MLLVLASVTSWLWWWLYLRSSTPQQQPRRYHAWSSEEIYKTLMQWNSTYDDNNVVQVISAQKTYNVPPAGTHDDCSFERQQQQQPSSSSSSLGCTTWILTIGNKTKPHVLLSGALHGDERVGPTVVMETASLLLQATTVEAACGVSQEASWCAARQWGRQLLLLTRDQRQWLLRLVRTRYIIILPSANALGYDRHERLEESVDPNRDFPFDTEEKTLQSRAAQAMVQVFENHLIQLAVTFHAGMEAIAYEWGTWSHHLDGKIAPDGESQEQLSRLYQRVSRSGEDDELYPVGTMNELVYPVNGGMEDWSYAASWDAASTTVVSNSTCRAFTVLVETSDDKQPEDLGVAQDVLGKGSGLVNRNLRLSLAMIEMVEPYVMVETVNGVNISSDAGVGCGVNVSVPEGTESVQVSWSVGGALTVEETRLLYGSERGSGNGLSSHCGGTHSFSQSELEQDLLHWKSTPNQHGTTKWIQGDGRFHAIVPLAATATRVHALARVDASWAGGETHVSRTRTDPMWFHRSGDEEVQGRLDWISAPLTIQLGPTGSAVRKVVEESSSSATTLHAAHSLIVISAVIGCLAWSQILRRRGTSGVLCSTRDC